MSFSSDGQVEVQDSTPATVTYSEVQNFGDRCIYADRTREIGVPRQLVISHQKVGSGSDARLRSMVKFSNNVENTSLEGDILEHRVHIVVDTPLRVVGKTDVEDVLAQLLDFLGNSTVVDQLMNQEV
jgi:hypothetical protein